MMIIESICILLLYYLFFGILLYIIPLNTSGGYTVCAFEDYNILFIPFWLPLLFSDKMLWLTEK